MPHILAMSGSLRAVSSNSALVDAVAMLAPAGCAVEVYRGLGDLPHFNPDLEADLPAPVQALFAAVGRADALVISCPEYARGIPGSFKNALDWLVGSEVFPGKRVALFNASPRAGDAQAALRLVLTTMSAELVEEAALTLPLLARGLDGAAIAADAGLAMSIRQAVSVLVERN